MLREFKSSVTWGEAYINKWFEFCAIYSKIFDFYFALDCPVCCVTVLMLRTFVVVVLRAQT